MDHAERVAENIKLAKELGFKLERSKGQTAYLRLSKNGETYFYEWTSRKENWALELLHEKLHTYLLELKKPLG